MPTPAPVASVWLMPCPEDAAWATTLVRDLAARHGAPVFEPHLTIAGDAPAAPERLLDALAAVAGATTPFAAPIADIVTGEAYYRSLYARFERSAALDALKAAAVAAGLGGSLTDFTPHVSLLYGQPAPAAKAASAALLRSQIVGRNVRFDRLAVTTSADTVPIEDWRVVATCPLG